MIIDANANIWSAQFVSTGAGKLFLTYNTGTAAAPTYTNTNGFVSYTFPGAYSGSLGIDGSGNVWAGNANLVDEFTPTVSGATSSFNAPVVSQTTTASRPQAISEVDGNFTFWYPSLTSSGQIWYQFANGSPLFSGTAANNSGYLRPCYVPNGGTACDATLSNLYTSGTQTSTAQGYITGDARVVQVDSTGAIWVAAASNSTSAPAPVVPGYIVQIIGAGYPTWPLYQYGVFGKEPQ